jgi:hypothetical protein
MRSGRPASLIQLTLRTERPPETVIDELAALGVDDTTVIDRGATYLVIAPPDRRRWGPGRAVALAAAICLGVLIASALASVVVIVFLPLALLPFVPLLVEDQPMLAVGAVGDDDGATQLTVHGHAWGGLRTALDAYVATLAPVREGLAIGRAASAPTSLRTPAGVPGEAEGSALAAAEHPGSSKRE